MPIYMDARTGDPTPVVLANSARVPTVGFRCSDAMNDPPVSIPVVKLASMAPTASTATLTFDTTVLPPPCTIQPCLPPPEPPPIDDVPGEGHDGDGGHPEYFPGGRLPMIRTSLAPARLTHLLSFRLMIQGISISIVCLPRFRISPPPWTV
jgi:hypothetical protein